jgi:TolB-like protein/DNA-binding winged helix-turn-helix (wHTH) protein
VPVVYKFGDFRLDCGRYELLRGDRPIKLQRKPLDLLLLFTSRQGQLITRAEIAEKLWSGDVFVDTEHGINTAIRKLRLQLRDDPAKPRFIQTVSGLGYRFVAPVTTEGTGTVAVEAAVPAETDSSESEVVSEPIADVLPAAIPGPTETGARSRRRVWWLMAAAAGIGSVVIFVAARRHVSGASAVHSVAILPLENLSGDADQEYLADGMTDELTTMLARHSNLRIPSRTSVMQYKKAHQALTPIAEALHVDAVVEGSITRTAGEVHMTLQLIRAEDDSHLWAQSYDQKGGATSLAETAAEDIAQELHTGRVDQVVTRTISPAAHDAYLRGRYLWFGRDIEKSGDWFRKATRLQPDYAAAWAGLSDYYGEGVAANLLDPRTALGPMEEAAKRALALDPELAEAHQAMAGVYLIAKWDWANADRESQRAIVLDPKDAELYYLRACVLLAMRRNPEAIEAAKRSMELAPLQRPGALGSILAGAGLNDEALEELRLRREALPNDSDLLFLTADTWRRKGDMANAAEFTEKAMIEVGSPDFAARLRHAWKQGGKRAFARESLDGLENWGKQHYISPVDEAELHAQLGEKEATLAALEEGLRQRSTAMLWIEEDPVFDFLRDEPRYRAVIEQIGRPKGN